MAEVEQFVNLTRSARWTGDGLASRDRMTTRCILRLRMRERRRATVRLTKEADSDNTDYSRAEKRRRQAFTARTYRRRRLRTERDGTAEIPVRVTLAGGDKYTITAEHDGHSATVDIVTRRRVYFQIVKMRGVSAVTAGDVNGMKREFWNPGQKLYVQMIEYAAGKRIPSRRNYDDTDTAVDNRVRRQVRRKYDDSKKPYAFVTLVALRNGIAGEETQTFAGNVPPGGGGLVLTTNRVLFDFVDPAEEWYVDMRWRPDGGRAVRIPKSALTRSGRSRIQIDTSGLPSGPGRLYYKVRVLQINGRGFSMPDNNYTLVASQDAVTGAAVPATEVMGVLIHEIGYKIGMVPGGAVRRADRGRPASDRHYLDRQPTYYWARGHSGGHCHHGTALIANFSSPPTGTRVTADCVMFGDTSSNTSSYCSDCQASLRKLDLRSRTNPGLRRQF